jgi:hypothetical protein
MKHIKYKVSLPFLNTEPIEYKEYYFVNKVDVCEFLEISPNTFMRLCEGTLCFKKKNIQKLYGIKVEKIPAEKFVKLTHDIVKDQSITFVNKLIEKDITVS